MQGVVNVVRNTIHTAGELSHIVIATCRCTEAAARWGRIRCKFQRARRVRFVQRGLWGGCAPHQSLVCSRHCTLIFCPLQSVILVPDNPLFP
jgi:hypothetical protein